MKPSHSLGAKERAIVTAIAGAPEPPGSIVRDFDALLDYLGTEGVPVSPKNAEFAIAKLPEINARLCEPGNIGLARGRQMSYPQVDGLHLLLRSSRIGKVERSQATPRMIVDSVMRERWRALNATERYFALLEAWWSFADEDQGHFGYRASSIAGCRHRLLLDLKKGDDLQGDAQRALLHFVGMKEVALMQMFGMLDVRQGEALAGEGWRIERMSPTPWGQTACASFARAFSRRIENLLESLFVPACSVEEDDGEGEDDRPAFHRWAAELNPLFAAWKNSLAKPEFAASASGTITLKVSLAKTLWRRIAMPAECTFADLAMTILSAFGFDDDHLYQFAYQDEYGVKRTLDDHRCDDAIDEFADALELGQARLVPKQKIAFRYDFGDDWRFEVLVEKVDALGAVGTPEIVARQGDAPQQYQWD